MQFNEREIKFLIQPHVVEHAAIGQRSLRESVDLRELGCPERLFERILEFRAQRLGAKFAEFRGQHQEAPAPAESLESKIQSSKLF